MEQNPYSYINHGLCCKFAKKKQKKTKIYNTNVDLVNDNVKFCLNLSIHCQDMEQKPNYGVNQGL